jgi:hypothetical protein
VRRTRAGIAASLASLLAVPPAAPQGTNQDALRSRLDQLVQREQALAPALELSGQSQVVVGIRPGLVAELATEVARRYLDHVEVDLRLDRRVEEAREVEVDTPLGRVTAGRWRLDLIIHGLRGTLRARPPTVKAAGGNRIDVRLPVVLEEANGQATARFEWDARTLAGVVCRDFELTRRIHGRVLPDVYDLAGQFEVAAGPTALVFQTVAMPRRLRVRLDLSAASWDDVRGALEEQDRLLRCGMAIDPEVILPRLRELLRGGFDVRLPRSLFRPVALPAALSESVRVEGRQVDLTVRTQALRVTPERVWYGARVLSRLQEPLATPPR